MNLPTLSSLSKLSNVRFHPGAELSSINSIEKKYDVKLLQHHKEFLEKTNGIEIFHNYFRLFGINRANLTDILSWNDNEYWKFSWNGRCSAYICFGETAWGDQYAYDIEQLREGNENVYFLDCLSMTPTLLAPSFSEFMNLEFIPSATEPYDEMITEAHRKFGEIDVSDHLIYTPSLLIGGKEDIENVQKMPARSAMICNGDIAIELDAGPDDSSVVAITQYKDADNRIRLRLVWA